MRHQVSSRQLALWPRHEISEVWAPTGIYHPPPASTEVQETAETRSDSASITALTRATGTCGQVGRGSRRHGRGGVAAGRRVHAVDLV